MSIHATFSIVNMLIQEAISLHMIRFLFLLEMYGQRQSDLSSVRVDLKAYSHDSCTQRARKSCNIFFLYMCPPLTALPYLSCDVLNMHNIMEALLINVDISMETFL